jgi:hypothetical protein
VAQCSKGQESECGERNVEGAMDEHEARARAGSAALEVEVGRDSGRRGLKSRRALTRFSNKFSVGFRIPELVGCGAGSLTKRRLAAANSPPEAPHPNGGSGRGPLTLCLLAARVYQMPERSNTMAQAAVKQMRNGEGSMNQAPMAAAAESAAQT